MKKRSFLVIFCIGIGAAFAQNEGNGNLKTYASVKEALIAERNFSGNSGPANLNWIDEGTQFSYTTSSGTDSEIRKFNPKTLKDELIFTTKGLTFPGESKAFVYSSFQWSKDSKFIVFQTNFRRVWRRSGTSDYYLYSLDSKKLQLVAKDARTAQLSPDGTKVGYERDGNMFLYDLADFKNTQLTFDNKPFFYNGRFGWVYEEEFGLGQAWEWSPDSKYIAFWQTDESMVPIFKMTDFSGQHAQYSEIPYPKVGDPIPEVKVGVVNVGTKGIKMMDVASNKGYIPRLYWTANSGTLGVVHLNRKQNHLKLSFFDSATGHGRLIMEEQSKAWIDLLDFNGSMHYFFFPDNKEEFYWLSDRDGWSHIYRYDYNGKLINQVTKGNWEISELKYVDVKSNTIYYTSTEASSLERQLYSINVDGKNKQRLTSEEGTHQVNVSPNGHYFMDSYSNVTTPRQVKLKSGKGNLVHVFQENKQVLDFISKNYYAPKELFSFITSEGVKLEGHIIKPKDFDENKKYPMVMDVYGGPGAKFVTNSWTSSGWATYMSQIGYVIVNVNNRGSGGYGRDFQKIVYRENGKHQALDFVETAKYFGAKSWIDKDNIAIKGTSFGGFASSFTMLKHPGVFKAAVVGAPITDWKLYDATYSERFMDLIEDNKNGYEATSPVGLAANLKGYMYLGHSAMDDNVHFQNSMQLVTALINAGKDIELKVYPQGGHSVSYNTISRYLYSAQHVDFLNRALKGDFKTNEVLKIND